MGVLRPAYELTGPGLRGGQGRLRSVVMNEIEVPHVRPQILVYMR